MRKLQLCLLLGSVLWWFHLVCGQAPFKIPPLPVLPQAYPNDAFYVPLANQTELQSALDHHLRVRLDANAIYTGNPLIMRSGYELHGLPGTYLSLQPNKNKK